MEAKYYTPEIEEFHIGFEYEYKSDTYMEVLDKTEGFWVKEIYSCSCLMDGESENNDIESLIKEKNIRVKHLDRQDIEECGWELDGDSGDWSSFNYKKYSTSLFFSSGYKRQYEYPCKVKIVIDDEVVFNGYIKNKSELQKLMKQLNIQTNKR